MLSDEAKSAGLKASATTKREERPFRKRRYREEEESRECADMGSSSAGPHEECACGTTSRQQVLSGPQCRIRVRYAREK